MIVCDSCDEEHHHSIVRGGVKVKTWRGRAPAMICPRCIPVVQAALLLIMVDDNFLLAAAEPGETFRQFVLRTKSHPKPVEPSNACEPSRS